MREVVECWFDTFDVFREDDIVRHKDSSPFVKENVVRTALIAEKLTGNAPRLHFLSFRGWK